MAASLATSLEEVTWLLVGVPPGVPRPGGTVPHLHRDWRLLLAI